jgi:hypothetical protein
MSIDWDNKIDIPEPLHDEINFEWLNDIHRKIDEILHINDGDFDEQFLELCRMRFQNSWKFFQVQSDWSIRKVFWNWNYIKLIPKWSSIHVDMIQMPNKWIECMLDIFSYAIDNNYTEIKWSAQPQLRPTESKRKRLVEFHSSFWMTNLDWYNSFIKLNLENKKVLVNKVKYFLENWRWFWHRK